MAHLFCH